MLFEEISNFYSTCCRDLFDMFSRSCRRVLEILSTCCRDLVDVLSSSCLHVLEIFCDTLSRSSRHALDMFSICCRDSFEMQLRCLSRFLPRCNRGVCRDSFRGGIETFVEIPFETQSRCLSRDQV